MRSLFSAIVVVLALLANRSGGAQERLVAPVIVQVPSINVQQTFLYGERQGYFRQEGLDVRTVVIRPHLGVATLLSGDTHFTAQFQGAFYAGLRGAPVKALFVINSRPGGHIVAAPEIKTGKDLKGKAIAVSGLGTSTHYTAMKAMEYFGLNPLKDVTYVGIGDDKSKLGALKSGVVQAVQLSEPWHIEAKKLGGRELLFVGDVVELASSGLGTSDKFLKENPLTVKRMLRALLKTTRDMRERPADFGEFFAKSLKIDRELSMAASDIDGRTMSVDGLLTDTGYRNLVEAGIQSGAVKGTPIRENAVDFTLLREVLREAATR